MLEVSRLWTVRTGGAVELGELMRVYRLDRSETDAECPDELDAVAAADQHGVDLAARWGRAFGVYDALSIHLRAC